MRPRTSAVTSPVRTAGLGQRWRPSLEGSVPKRGKDCPSERRDEAVHVDLALQRGNVHKACDEFSLSRESLFRFGDDSHQRDARHSRHRED